jgi:hypothetical protein
VRSLLNRGIREINSHCFQDTLELAFDLGDLLCLSHDWHLLFVGEKRILNAIGSQILSNEVTEMSGLLLNYCISCGSTLAIVDTLMLFKNL